jgi:hypothetical protein
MTHSWLKYLSVCFKIKFNLIFNYSFMAEWLRIKMLCSSIFFVIYIYTKTSLHHMRPSAGVVIWITCCLALSVYCVCWFWIISCKPNFLSVSRFHSVSYPTPSTPASPERETKHSPPSSSEVRETCIYTSNLPHHHGMYFIKYSAKLTLGETNRLQAFIVYLYRINKAVEDLARHKVSWKSG